MQINALEKHIDRRKFGFSLVKGMGSAGLGVAAGGTVLKELLATQCENPLGGKDSCGGGGNGGGGGGGGWTTEWTPYSPNWSNTFGQSATQTYDSGQITGTLASLYNTMRQYNSLTSAEMQQFYGFLISHANFHAGSSSNYHYSTLATLVWDNIPPYRQYVQLQNLTLSQQTSLNDQWLAKYGVDLTPYYGNMIDPSFGTTTPSAGLSSLASNGLYASEVGAGNAGEAGNHTTMCGDLAAIRDVLGIAAGLAGYVAISGLFVPIVAEAAGVLAAAFALGSALSEGVMSYEHC